MPPFRRVEGVRAGPTALGILVPPGPRTLVVVRPRALDWDLVALAPGGAAFCEFGRDEAAGVARQFQRALEAGAGANPLEAVPSGEGYRVTARVGERVWVACRRAPGRPYEPALFAARADADEVIDGLARVLCPPADAAQEYYFNTQQFQSQRLPT